MWAWPGISRVVIVDIEIDDRRCLVEFPCTGPARMHARMSQACGSGSGYPFTSRLWSFNSRDGLCRAPSWCTHDVGNVMLTKCVIQHVRASTSVFCYPSTCSSHFGSEHMHACFDSHLSLLLHRSNDTGVGAPVPRDCRDNVAVPGGRVIRGSIASVYRDASLQPHR